MPSGWAGSSTSNSISVALNDTSGTISVTADNVCGSSAARTLAVTIGALPTADFSSVDNGSGTVDFTDISANATSWAWTFGDGNSSTAQNPSNSYTANGNYTVKELAEVIHKIIPNSRLVFTGEHLKDSRTYKVSFKKILTELKDYYKPQWNLEKGALELLNFFKERNFDESQFRGIYTNRLSCLSNLIFNKKINHQFRFI
jgi:hypothetical protein